MIYLVEEGFNDLELVRAISFLPGVIAIEKVGDFLDPSKDVVITHRLGASGAEGICPVIDRSGLLTRPDGSRYIPHGWGKPVFANPGGQFPGPRNLISTRISTQEELDNLALVPSQTRQVIVLVDGVSHLKLGEYKLTDNPRLAQTSEGIRVCDGEPIIVLDAAKLSDSFITIMGNYTKFHLPLHRLPMGNSLPVNHHDTQAVERGARIYYHPFMLEGHNPKVQTKMLSMNRKHHQAQADYLEAVFGLDQLVDRIQESIHHA